MRAFLATRTGLSRATLHAIAARAGATRAPGWATAAQRALLGVLAVQAITGVALMTVYAPATQAAWASVHYTTTALPGGWLLRGLHHTASHALVVLLVIDIAIAVSRRAYASPREVAWWTQLVRVTLVLGLAITGHLLPWDQKGWWARRVELGILEKVPLLGPPLRELVQGGGTLGQIALTRAHALHTTVLPLLVTVATLAHLALQRRARRLQDERFPASARRHVARAARSTDSDEPPTARDGSIAADSGSKAAPDAGHAARDGSIAADSGSKAAPDGNHAAGDGSIAADSGRKAAPDGESHAAGDGSIAADSGSKAAPDERRAARARSIAADSGSKAAPDDAGHAAGDGSIAADSGSHAASDASHSAGDGRIAADSGSNAASDASHAGAEHAAGDGSVATPDSSILAPLRHAAGDAWAQLARDAFATALVVATAVALAVVAHGAPLDAPADPASDYPARPEWFLAPMFLLRKLTSGPYEVLGTALPPMLLAIYLVALPWIDRRGARRPSFAVAAPLLAALAFALTAVVTVPRMGRHDATTARAVARAETRARLAFDLARDGVPPAVTLELLRTSAAARGEDLFARHCASCHVLGPLGDPAKSTAPTLDRWSTEPWIRDLLHDPDTDALFGRTPYATMMPSLELPPKDRKPTDPPFTPTPQGDLRAIAAFLAAQGDDPTDVPARPRAAPSDLARGELLVKERCTTCHLYGGEGDDNAQEYAPELKGYGSLAWTRAQIANPATPATYRPKALDESMKKHMPRFDAELAPRDLDLLARYVRARARGLILR